MDILITSPKVTDIQAIKADYLNTFYNAITVADITTSGEPTLLAYTTKLDIILNINDLQWEWQDPSTIRMVVCQCRDQAVSI
eukprot:12502603-Ditylum_brightwellii.AAC.1